MAKAPATRVVTCYHCRAVVELSAQARSATCPKCHKGLVLDDVVVEGYRAVRKIQTCGRVVVEKKGRFVGQSVEAIGGVEIQGTVEANIICGGRVHMGPKSHLKGDLTAGSLAVELGATIAGAVVKVPEEREKAAAS
ncbi:MAG: polymer-forming cytoskeletal protein [Phycisphaeraceae bacterium]|nr:polymer-forming cytoskeletal protein [Phycisphaeraceae bacterium]